VRRAFQHFFQQALAFDIPDVAQIVTIEIKQIEGMLANPAALVPAKLAPQRLKIRPARIPIDDSFPVNHHRMLQRCRRSATSFR